MKPLPLLCIMAALSPLPAAQGAVRTYDVLNRLKSASYDNGLTISYTYDSSGNRTSRTVTNTSRQIAVSVPNGGGYVSGQGFKLLDSTATLQATAYSGYEFGYWKEADSITSYENPLSFVVTQSRSLEAYFSPIGSYNAFASRYRLDPAGSGSPTIDLVGDGFSNLVKFALGADPKVYNAAILPTGHWATQNGNTVFIYEFNYSVAAEAAVAIDVEYSTDLRNWITAVSGQNGVTVVTTAVDSAINHTTVTIPVTTSTIFARLRVVRP